MRSLVAALLVASACSPPVRDTAPRESSTAVAGAASVAPIALPADLARWSREDMIARGGELTPELVVGLVEDAGTRESALAALPFMPGSEDALGLLASRARERRSPLLLTAMEKILSTSRTLPPPEDVEAARTTSRTLDELSRDAGELGVLASNVKARLRARGLAPGD